MVAERVRATAAAPGQVPGARESALRVTDVSKAFGVTQALAGVDLELARGEIHGLVGSNGSGKSTLIKILAGVCEADTGTIEVAGQSSELATHTPKQAADAGFHFVHQETTTFADLTVAENLAIGSSSYRRALAPAGKASLCRRAQLILDRFQIDAAPNDLLGELRPATRMMVTIARALQDQFEAGEGVLVLDEPTAALEPGEVNVLLKALRRYAAAGQAILFVSHHLEEILEVTDRATVLRDGRVAGVMPKHEFDEDALVEMIVGKSLEAYFPGLPDEQPGSAVVETHDLHAGALAGASVQVRAREIVGVTGRVGAGHTDLLRVLFGAEPLEAGTIELEGEPAVLRSPADAVKRRVAYVPADRAEEALFPDLSLMENLSQASLPQYARINGLNGAAERADAAADIERFGIRTGSYRTPVHDLSGGNQQKSVLARWLRRNPSVLLLEEPTQGVDVAARAEIWEMVADVASRGSAVLVASSDLEELSQMCERVLVFRNGDVMTELSGDALTAERLLHLLYGSAIQGGEHVDDLAG